MKNVVLDYYTAVQIKYIVNMELSTANYLLK